MLQTDNCLSQHLARGGGHMGRGEWASSHAIASGLRRCAQRCGCPDGRMCALAAETLMGKIREMVRDDEGLQARS